jgi:hypothetical protein
MILSRGLFISLGFSLVVGVILFLYINRKYNSIENKVNRLFQLVQEEATKQYQMNQAMRERLATSNTEQQNIKTHAQTTETGTEINRSQDSGNLSENTQDDNVKHIVINSIGQNSSLIEVSDDELNSDSESEDTEDDSDDDNADNDDDDSDEDENDNDNNNSDEDGDVNLTHNQNSHPIVLNGGVLITTSFPQINELDEEQEVDLSQTNNHNDNDNETQEENNSNNSDNKKQLQTLQINLENSDIKTIHLAQNTPTASVNYKKMPIAQLRQLVSDKNLHSEPKKLKKHDLVELLENDNSEEKHIAVDIQQNKETEQETQQEENENIATETELVDVTPEVKVNVGPNENVNENVNENANENANEDEDDNSSISSLDNMDSDNDDNDDNEGNDSNDEN